MLSWHDVLKASWFVNESTVKMYDVAITQDDCFVLGPWHALEIAMHAKGWCPYQQSAWYALLLLLMRKRRCLNGWQHHHMGSTHRHSWVIEPLRQQILQLKQAKSSWQWVLIGDAVFQSGDQSHQDASILHVIKEWMLQEGTLLATFCGDDQTVEWYPWVHPDDGQEQAWQDVLAPSQTELYIQSDLRPKVGVSCDPKF